MSNNSSFKVNPELTGKVRKIENSSISYEKKRNPQKCHLKLFLIAVLPGYLDSKFNSNLKYMTYRHNDLFICFYDIFFYIRFDYRLFSLNFPAIKFN